MAQTLDKDRLRADLRTIGETIVERIPLQHRVKLRVMGVDLSESIQAICDDLAALPDDDLGLILQVVRWEAHALLGAIEHPEAVPLPRLRVDDRTRRALASVIDVLTKGL